ncbi:hypothetical protein [Streptomyces sp. NPDC048386]|uniref:hypothetical protein n=1 Tax=Streptomyces sp. NPDC048386 TaxID=3365541 RepID=UPI003720F865
MADALTELTAAQDGFFAAVEQVLDTAADFHDGLGGTDDGYVAGRLRFLVTEYLQGIRSEICYFRNRLADRHAPRLARRTSAGQVAATGREACAVCACPPPRTVPAPPAASAGPRR